jgi:hypothetical protein
VGKPHALELSTCDDTFLLYADSEAEKDAWIAQIGRSIVRCVGAAWWQWWSR